MKQLIKEGKRKCFRCKKIYPLTAEYFNRRYSNRGAGFRYECKKCKHKRYKTLPSYKSYYDRNKGKINTKAKIRNRFPQARFNLYKKEAKKRELKWNLTFKQFMSFWQEPCHYCGSNIETIGLDRVNNDDGYTIDNVVSCCWACNKMKSALNEDEFINQCLKVTKRQIK